MGFAIENRTTRNDRLQNAMLPHDSSSLPKRDRPERGASHRRRRTSAWDDVIYDVSRMFRRCGLMSDPLVGRHRLGSLDPLEPLPQVDLLCDPIGAR